MNRRGKSEKRIDAEYKIKQLIEKMPFGVIFDSGNIKTILSLTIRNEMICWILREILKDGMIGKHGNNNWIKLR